MFGADSISLADFQSRMSPHAITDLGTWCNRCENTQVSPIADTLAVEAERFKRWGKERSCSAFSTSRLFSSFPAPAAQADILFTSFSLGSRHEVATLLPPSIRLELFPLLLRPTDTSAPRPSSLGLSAPSSRSSSLLWPSFCLRCSATGKPSAREPSLEAGSAASWKRERACVRNHSSLPSSSSFVALTPLSFPLFTLQAHELHTTPSGTSSAAHLGGDAKVTHEL